MLAIHRRTLYLLLVISLGHVLLISVQVQSKSGLPLLETLSFSAFSNVQRGSTGLADGLASLWRQYLALGRVSRENEALRAQVTELQSALAEERAAATRTQALENMLAMRESMPMKTVIARVIAGSPSPESLTITIDRGSDDGIQDSLAVLAPAGVVGRIIGRPASHLSQVQLLIGRTAAAGAYLERTGAGGVVTGGFANPPLQMLYLPSAADVKPGDRVLTSGQDSLFPKGFLIGTVERTDHTTGLYRTTTITPAVDFSHIEAVMIVLERPVAPPAMPEIPPPAAAGPAGRGRGGL